MEKSLSQCQLFFIYFCNPALWLIQECSQNMPQSDILQVSFFTSLKTFLVQISSFIDRTTYQSEGSRFRFLLHNPCIRMILP